MFWVLWVLWEREAGLGNWPKLVNKTRSACSASPYCDSYLEPRSYKREVGGIKVREPAA